MRRAKPLLGTLVEIRVGAGGDWEAALAAAFDEISTCQAHMSAHQPESDVRHLAATAPGEIVAVDRRTWEVLSLAQELAAATDGLFDVTVAPRLAAAGYLPVVLAGGQGDWRDLELLPGHRLRSRLPLAVDLGGIAKGYAVDQAVEVLLAHGIDSGCVNAGGDLRLFGPEVETVHLRHPADPTRMLPVGELADGACATTAPYFARRGCGGVNFSPLVDPRNGHLLSDFDSITVIAPRCAHADALTKVALLLGNSAGPLLKRYDAYALRLDKEGTLAMLPSAEPVPPPPPLCRSPSRPATSD